MTKPNVQNSTAMLVRLDSLGFSRRTLDGLAKYRILTVGDLVPLSELNLNHMTPINKRSVKEIIEVMIGLGWTWPRVGDGPMQRIEPAPVRKPGRPVGTLRPGATASINIRLTPERKKQLLDKAQRDNTTMSGVVDNWIGLCCDD